MTSVPPHHQFLIRCILRKLFQLSTARMTSAPLALSPPSAGCSQGVAQSAGRGREGEGKKIQASRSLFRAVPAFSTRSGKGAGHLFCGLWMSRNDGGGARSRVEQTLIYGQFSRYAQLAVIIWPYFQLKKAIY